MVGWTSDPEGLEKVEAVKRAWLNAGSHPEYHRIQQDKLRQQWPVLAQAIDHLCNMQTGPTPPKGSGGV